MTSKCISINLSDDQNILYDKLLKFIDDKSINKELLVIGFAGTGKTTLITYFINKIITENLIKRIAIAAPTHKAVNIVKSKLLDQFIDKNDLYKITIMTIHRLLNYQNNIDPNGNKFFSKGINDPNWNIYDLIIIDECSMLSNQIIDDIDLILSKKKCKSKIIYIGDPAQLPPVNQSDSKIFNKKIEKLYLEKILRTSNNQIMELSNQHRKWIFGDKDKDLPHIFDFICDKIKVYSNNSNQKIFWLNKFIELLGLNENNQEIDILKLNNIILTWTNNKCSEYNNFIRKKLFNKKNLEKYEIGEILIFNDYHKIQIKKINYNNSKNDNDNNNDDFENIYFYTSEQIKLLNLSITNYKIDKIKIQNTSSLNTSINDEFKKKIKQINKLIDVELKVFNLSVKKLSDNDEYIYNLISIHPETEKLYSNILDDFDKIINKLRNNCYKIINQEKLTNIDKSNVIDLIDKKINNIWKFWQTFAIDKFAQLNYGYALTVHKSQGSTFDNVFIDISDILNNNNIDELSKCLYTAITRSSETLQLLI